MSISKLIEDKYKPWANLRICNLQVDCDSNINGFGSNTGFYSAIRSASGGTPQLPNLTFDYRPILTTTPGIEEESNGFMVNAVNDTLVVTYIGAPNIYVNIVAKIELSNSEDIGYGLAIFKNGSSVTRSQFNGGRAPPYTISNPSNIASLYVGNIPLENGDELILYLATAPFLSSPLGAVTVDIYNLYITAN